MARLYQLLNIMYRRSIWGVIVWQYRTFMQLLLIPTINDDLHWTTGRYCLTMAHAYEIYTHLLMMAVGTVPQSTI